MFPTLGTPQDRRLVLLHEKVHQFLAPKMYLMRNVRVQGRLNSYSRSSLHRWLKEALAETFARMRVPGFNLDQAWNGMSFPVKSGDVLLKRGGGFDKDMSGRGLWPKGGALLATGTINGISWNAFFHPTRPAGNRR